MKYYRNCELAFLGSLLNIVTAGKIRESRNGKCKEVLHEALTIQKPLERCIFLEGRNDSIFHKIAETLWVLAGRDDMGFLEYYLPRCREWSDDGEVWRAGYGPRLRSFSCYDDYLGVDQIEQCVRLLNKDRDTRRAVISLWDPNMDWVDSKDIPCNNWLNFIIRDGKLHLSIAQRSSDVWWGFSGINMFEWSVLMQMMAYWTGTEVGTMTYFITSFHLYEPMWKKASNVLKNGKFLIDSRTAYENAFDCPKFNTEFDVFDDAMGKVFQLERELREGHINFEVWDAIQGAPDPFLRNCLQMLYLHAMLKDDNVTYLSILHKMDEMDKTDFWNAAQYNDYMTHKFGS